MARVGYSLHGLVYYSSDCHNRTLALFDSGVACRKVALADTNTSMIVCRRFKDNDRFLGANPKTSTRFDRHFSIMDYLRINLGAERGLPLVSAVF